MRISVVMPAYNAARYIDRALDSILCQSFPADEIIVVDDGSHDGTSEMVERLVPSVTLVRQANGGPSMARNAGIAVASGELIAFLDADDWWADNKLELQVASFQDSTDIILSYTGMYIVEENVVTRQSKPPASSQLWPSLRWSNRITPSTVMVRRAALLQVAGFAEDLWVGEDWDLWVRLSKIGKFTNLNQPLTYYRYSQNSLSSDAEKMFRDSCKLLDRTLVADLSGIKRWWWTRRILSYQAFSAAMTARSAGNAKLERKFLFASFRYWPSPFWATKRFKTAILIMLRSLSSISRHVFHD
jgi:glycosyltransferase involved in cell wall biosynthesis